LIVSIGLAFPLFTIIFKIYVALKAGIKKLITDVKLSNSKFASTFAHYPFKSVLYAFVIPFSVTFFASNNSNVCAILS
jgi:hypothetical protein